MTDEQLSRVFDAFLSRITPADLRRINEAIAHSEQASAQWGMSAQIEAQNKQRTVVKNAVGHLLEHDKTLIQAIIAEAAA